MADNLEPNQVRAQLWQALSLLEVLQKSFTDDEQATQHSAVGGIIKLMNEALCELEEMELTK